MMKKILSIFAAASLLAVLVLPAVSLAQSGLPEQIPTGCVIDNSTVRGLDACKDQFDSSSGLCPTTNTNCGACCLLNTIYTVTNWVFYILMLVAVLMIVYGGFIYISAAGDPAKAAKGKTVLTLSIIGLAIALLAKLIPSLVRFILGV
ncbi:MAG: pilin [Candidatus Pacebacteria bacterium]|nr:pilin [Candidatus Paceibacterota bacterium]